MPYLFSFNNISNILRYLYEKPPCNNKKCGWLLAALVSTTTFLIITRWLATRSIGIYNDAFLKTLWGYFAEAIPRNTNPQNGGGAQAAAKAAEETTKRASGSEATNKRKKRSFPGDSSGSESSDSSDSEDDGAFGAALGAAVVWCCGGLVTCSGLCHFVAPHLTHITLHGLMERVCMSASIHVFRSASHKVDGVCTYSPCLV